ncbi:hypothetical protein GGS24DRAFT_476570 [Hypoxylon argillaceum]|nr:hypothetical protein GGS24DRAFT_476570 [Hypoxylon argillaceum]KAI1147568.1 hypothetical protein F4825DRAFT_436949 [Nemania diffusa]
MSFKTLFLFICGRVSVTVIAHHISSIQAKDIRVYVTSLPYHHFFVHRIPPVVPRERGLEEGSARYPTALAYLTR